MFKFKPTCSLCKAIGVNKLTCPLNRASRKPNYTTHQVSADVSFDGGQNVIEPTNSFGISDISAFFTSNLRGKNDSMNNKREFIIYNIMTNQVNPDWYEENQSWKIIDEKLRVCLKDFTLLSRKGGRSHCHDFDVEHKQTGQRMKMEFKFNAESISSCPQWVSPMKPSQYLKKSYEEHHYDNYLKRILDLYDVPIPSKEDYLKKVHSHNYLADVQVMYKRRDNEQDIVRYEETKKLTDDSILTFFQSDVELNVEKLNEYLLKTQKDKIYLIYHDGIFRLEERDETDYTIEPLSIIKTHNSFNGLTVSGLKIKILLRWKNCKGVAFPAFQIT